MGTKINQLKVIVRRYEKALLIVTGAAGLTTFLMSLQFNLLEGSLYDFRMTHGPQSPADPSIVLIALDEQTTKTLDELSPLPLDLHVRFLEAMERLEPRALGYLIDFNQVNQLNPDFFHKEWGQRFVQASLRMEAKGTTLLLGTPYDLIPPYPLSSLPHSIVVIHKDGNVFSEDNVTRRALTYLNDKPVFHMELAQRLGGVLPNANPRGTYKVSEVNAKFFFFKYHGSTSVPDPHPSHLPYQRISFIDILRGRLEPGSLRGKTVLVGTLSKESSSDFTLTPYSKTSFTNPKLLVHANILDAVLHDHGIIRAPSWVNWLVTFSVTSFVIWWVLNSTPLAGVFSTLGLMVSYFIFIQLLFSFKGVWLRASQPLVGIFVGYYLVVPYRLIREYKKRWDYQRENELLTQVEELKTNFLSLVTHDLKTPVARIQGLAEVLLRKSSSRLLPRDQETLRHIISSTDELNRFITSLLELNKVESNRLQMQLESKDINQLIERAVEDFKASARSKRIRISTHLEPLFPIRMDSSLISKVINNLIDNAIKYSSHESQIVIESKEIDAWVKVTVRDQGIGLTREECDNLFTRFYRAKNDTTAQIAGTGLGLYLTKYFIEAHQGKVSVESEIGKGSAFSILLPLSSETLYEKKEIPHVQNTRC